VLTESAAILLWLLQQKPDSPLLPSSPAARASLYRWTVFIAANVYAAIIIGDYPDRWTEGDAGRQALKAGTIKRTLMYWKMMEDALQPGPYLLGDTLTALDVYAAAVSRWRPGRKVIAETCPRLVAALEHAEKHPAVTSVWSRNFPG
jgi:GST-like protein